MSSPEVLAIFEKIKKLSQPELLRLAADLLDHNKPDMAYSLVKRVEGELGYSLALQNIERTPRP